MDVRITGLIPGPHTLDDQTFSHYKFSIEEINPFMPKDLLDQCRLDRSYF